MSFKPIPNLDGTQANFTGGITAGAITGSALTINTNTLFVDSSNERVGIGTTSPVDTLDVKGSNPRVRLIDTTVPNDPAAYMWNSEGSLLFRADVTQARANTYIRFDIDQSEKLRITDGGNVGIGTTSPAQKLHINGGVARFSNNSSNYLEIDGSDSANNHAIISSRFNQLQFKTNTGAGSPHISLLPATGGDVYVGTNLDVSDNATIDGNVGIGTASPSEKLHVVGDSLVSGDSHADALKPASSGEPIKFKNFAGTELVRIADSGEVGVGTTSPSHPLEVAGNIKGSSFTIGTDTAYSNDLNITNSGKIRIGNAEFFAKSSNDLSIYSAKLNVTSAGNVGIGTTSPTEKLHIESGNLLIKPNAVSASHSGLLLGINKYNSGKAGLYGATDGAASNTDGNLYISTRNVSSSNGSYIQLGQRSSTTTSDKGTIVLQAGKYNTNNQTGDILLKYGITDTVTLQGSSGNVGIGTTSPSKKLDVVGDIKSSATVEGAGGVILTSPGGGRFLVTINNSGELQSSSL